MGAAFFVNSMLMIGSIQRVALGLIALAVSSVTQAKPVAFKPPVELTDSVNVNSPVWIDADGDGVTDLTGYDAVLRKMVSCVRDPRGSQWPKKRMIHEGVSPEDYFESFRWDLDGDGKLDLVAVEGHHIFWWKAASGAPLAYQGRWGTSLPPNRVVAGFEDMDKDGHLDVLLCPTTGVADEEGNADAALIAYGDATGGFTYLEVDFNVPRFDYYDSQVADINGDGTLDWILYGRLALLRDRQQLQVMDLPHWGSGVQLGDIDGSPGVELVVTEGLDRRNDWITGPVHERIRILKLQGDAWNTVEVELGSILFSGWYPAPEYLGAHVGNFDSDPLQEIVIVSRDFLLIFGYIEGRVAPERGHAITGGLQKGDWISVGRRVPGGRDSLLIHRYADARFSDNMGMYFQAAPFWLHMDVPTDEFGQAYTSAVSPMHHPRSIAVVKMEGGSKIASLGGHDRGLHVWRSPTGVAEKRTVSVNEKQGITLLAGKFRGGTEEELVWLSSDEDSADNFSIGSKASLLEVGKPYTTDGNGISRYRKLNYSGVMPAALLGKGDFDGDGTDDLLYTNPADGVMVWRSGNDPTAVGAVGKLGAVQHEVGYMPLIPKSETLHGASPQNVVILDMDQDGDPDILQFPSIFGNAVARYVNDGSGGFSVSRLGTEASDIPPGHIPVAIAAGNFDGNGIADIVILSSSGHTYDSLSRLRIMFDRGSGTSEIVNLQGNGARLVVADFNGDALDDVIFEGGASVDMFGYPVYGYPACQILSRKTSSSFDPPAIISTWISPSSSLVAADINGDGLADLIHGSSSSGTVSYFEATRVETMPTFVEWAAELEVSGQEVDTDGDGASNFYEYLTGGNPKLAESNVHGGAVPGEAPVINLNQEDRYPGSVVFSLNATHQRAANLPEGTARVVLESSTNLRDWVPIDRKPSVVLTEGHPGWETLRWEDISSLQEDEHGKFYRFRIWVE